MHRLRTMLAAACGSALLAAGSAAGSEGEDLQQEAAVDAGDVAPAAAPGPAAVLPEVEPGGRVARDAVPPAFRLAQFKLPGRKPEADGGGAPPAETGGDAARGSVGALPSRSGFGAPGFPARLTYQYGWATESMVEYRRDRDLNKRVKDNSFTATPELHAAFVYRPTDWLEATVEGILSKEFAVREEPFVDLPNGERQFPPKRRATLVLDQAFVKVHRATAPFEFTLGRRNYEDERHWIYDTAIDTATVAVRQGQFRVEAIAGREVIADLDLLTAQPHDRINTYMLYGEYRGDYAKLAAYTVTRDDRSKAEGRWQLTGVRALGTPTDAFTYWGELALMTGKDPANRRFSGHGFDVGGTYRWIGMQHLPSVTLGYAMGTGDGNPDDGKNREFRQTGLQSNEARFAGISLFRIYGEALDPELSNLHILTLAAGFRPTPSTSVDLVWHRYRLDKVADRLRSTALTAEINQVDGQASKDIGQEIDLIVGFRNLFGIRRLGVDLRAGWFRPGHAFLRDDGGVGRPADRGVAVIAKIWY